MPITEITRREIIDRLVAGQHDWAGRFNDVAFLSRLYDLNALPSSDYGFETAADFAERLDPYVRDKYLELWNAVATAPTGEEPGSESSADR